MSDRSRWKTTHVGGRGRWKTTHVGGRSKWGTRHVVAGVDGGLCM